MRIIGIDPGCYGAIALLVADQLEEVHDMPRLMVRRGKSDKAEVDGYSLCRLLSDMKADMAVVEQVGGMTGQSPSAAFNFGRACGAAEYVAKALGLRVEMAAPQTWKRALRLNPGKDASRALAMRTWPAMADMFKRVKDNDRAEAALIAEWGRLRFNPGGVNVFD